MSVYDSGLDFIENSLCFLVRVREEDLVFDRVREFAQALFETAADGPGLALDLTGVRVLNSTAVGALMKLHGNLEKAGVPMALVGPGPMIRDLFRMTRLDTYFNMTEDAMTLPHPSEWEGLKESWARRMSAPFDDESNDPRADGNDSRADGNEGSVS